MAKSPHVLLLLLWAFHGSAVKATPPANSILETSFDNGRDDDKSGRSTTAIVHCGGGGGKGDGVCPKGNTCCPLYGYVAVEQEDAVTNVMENRILAKFAVRYYPNTTRTTTRQQQRRRRQHVETKKNNRATAATATNTKSATRRIGIVGWGCVTNNNPGIATCCGRPPETTLETNVMAWNTACPPHYTCTTKTNNPDSKDNDDSWRHRFQCHRRNDMPSDPLVETIPRYQLCAAPVETHRFGFPLSARRQRPPQPRQEGKEQDKTTRREKEAQDNGKYYFLPHYASLEQGAYCLGSKQMSSLSFPSSSDMEHDNATVCSEIEMVLIVLHGAQRNADDYFCSAMAALQLQTVYRPESVLVLAPQYLSLKDDNNDDWDTCREEKALLRWNCTRDSNGPWRYGANDVVANMSSFHAMDQLLHQIVLGRRQESQDWRFPQLKRVTLVGHSSGGQFVQRYSLLSDLFHTWRHQRPSVQMAMVVANPSSYAYLTPQRFWQGQWQIPNRTACPDYDRWEWGLAGSGGGHAVAHNLEPVPYKRRAERQLRKRSNHSMSMRALLAHRFFANHAFFTYLNGAADRCNVSSQGWCDSHGLEVSCADEYQGSHRLERLQRYQRSLQRTFGHHHVVAVVVTRENIGHDHALLFQSEEGVQVLFGT